MNPIQLNEQQIEALSNDVTKLWLPLPTDITVLSCEGGIISYTQSGTLTSEYTEVFIMTESPLQPGEQYFCMTNTHLIFTATDVDVKYVQDIEFNSIRAIGCPALTDLPKAPRSMSDWFEKWHDSQYPDQPYSTKPVGFLVSIERITNESN